MKTTLSTLAFVLIAISTWAQDKITVLDSVHSRQNDWNTNTPLPDNRSYHLTDHKGRDTLKTIMRYDTDKDEFYFDERYATTYNAKGQIDVEVRWLHGSSKWFKNDKVEFTYNASGFITTKTTYTIFGTTWQPSARETFTYNSSDSLTEHLEEFYDAGSWIPLSKTTYTFNGLKRTESVIFNYDVNKKKWDSTAQTLLTYQGNLLTERLNRNYDFGQGKMVDALHDSFSYNNSRVLAMHQKFYDAFGGVWYEMLRDSFAYPSANEIIKTQYGNFGSWTPSIKYHTYKDQNGLDTFLLGSGYDFLSQSFVDQSKRVWRYNSKGLITYENSESYDAGIGKWILQFDNTYYYSERTTVGQKTPLSPQVIINQLGNRLSIISGQPMTSVRLYDINGRLIQQVSANQTQANVYTHYQGILMVLVEGPDWTWTGKVPHFSH